MGKGKGAVDYWVCPVRRGTLLYEVGGISKEVALQALKGGATKLPVATKIIF
jgi:large subunit ribosomal protein L16